MKICFENLVNSETSYGEPQAWIYLEYSDRSIEITHEEYGLDESEYYYSLRLHCSDDDFDNDKYHSTMGIIYEYSSCSEDDVMEVLMKLIGENYLLYGLVD